MKAFKSQLAESILAKNGFIKQEGQWVTLPGGRRLWMVPKAVRMPRYSPPGHQIAKGILIGIGLMFALLLAVHVGLQVLS